MVARIASILAVVATAIVALVSGVVLHLDLPPARRLVARALDGVLASSLPGTARIDGLRHLSALSLRAERFYVTTPEGVEVLAFEDIDARFSLFSMLVALVEQRGDIDIEVTELHAARGRVSLEQDESGALLLQRAFVSDEPTPPASGPEVSLRFPSIDVDAIAVYAPVAGIDTVWLDAVAARFLLLPDATTIGIDAALLEAESPLEGAPVAGLLQGEIVLPSDLPLAFEAVFRGGVGEVPLVAGASMEAAKIKGTALVGPAMTRALTRLVPAVDLPEQRLAAQLSVEGELPDLVARASAVLWGGPTPASELDVEATVDVEAQHVVADIVARRIDLSRFASDAPPSSLDLVAHAEGRVADDGPRGTFRAAVDAGSVAEQATPRVVLAGTLDGERVRARGSVAEPGAPLDVTFELVHGLTPPKLHALIHSQSLDLGKNQRLGGKVDGVGSATLRIDAILAQPTQVDAQLDAELSGLRADGFTSRDTSVTVDVAGALPAPHLSARLRGTTVNLRGLRFGSVAANVEGHRHALEAHLRLSDGGARVRSVEAETRAGINGAVVLRAPRLRIEGDDLLVRAGATRVVAGGDGFEVEDLRVDGFGDALEADVTSSPRGMKVELHGARIDLAKVAPLLGLGPERVAGELSLDVDLVRQRSGVIDGGVVAVLEKGRIDELGGLRGGLAAQLRRGELLADGHLDTPVGRVVLDIEPLRLGAGVPSWQSLRRATGKVAIGATITLEELAQLERAGWLEASLPFDVSGKLALSATASRDQATIPPHLELRASTKQLLLQEGTQFLHLLESPATREAAWRVRGLDLAAEITLDGSSGDGALELRVSDVKGGLLWIDADAELPYAELWRDDWRKLESEPLVSLLRDVPIHAWAHTAERRLRDLPRLTGTGDLEGRVKASAFFEGTLADPRAGVTARAFAIHGPDLGLTQPIDLVLVSTWDDGTGEAHAKVFGPRAQLVDAHARAELDLQAMLAGTPQPWSAEAQGRVCNLPLGLFSNLADQEVSGRVDGTIEIHDVNSPEVRVDGKLDVTGLRVGGSDYPRGRVSVTADRQRASARLALEQQKGHVRLAADLPLEWRGARPSLAPGRGGKVELDAKQLRLAFLQPFLSGTFDRVDGVLDARAKVDLGRTRRLSGSARLRKGRLQASAFGETFTDIRADVKLTPEGRLQLHKLTARAGEGALAASAEAELDGLALKRVRAALNIPEKQPIPLVIQGEQLGTAWGRFALRSQLDGSVDVDLDIQELGVTAARRPPNSARKLEPGGAIRIGTFSRGELAMVALSPPTPEAGGAAQKPIVITTHVRRDVVVRRGRDLEVWLRGSPRIVSGTTTRIDGHLNITGGRLEIEGRRFTLEHGIITFTGRPPNDPELSVTASWDAPDGTKVYAEYRGPISTGKVTLRSEPALTRDEIFALLVFGGPQGYSSRPAAGEASTSTQAVGLGGAYVAEGLNEAIDDLISLDVTARVGASPSNQPTTEVEWRIARQISVQLAHVLGSPPPGEIPDRNLGSITWQFAPRWSLKTTVGDQGSTILDVLWQHRY
jgi:translocation and assembly module TamB